MTKNIRYLSLYIAIYIYIGVYVGGQYLQYGAKFKENVKSPSFDFILIVMTFFNVNWALIDCNQFNVFFDNDNFFLVVLALHIDINREV